MKTLIGIILTALKLLALNACIGIEQEMAAPPKQVTPTQTEAATAATTVAPPAAVTGGGCRR